LELLLLNNFNDYHTGPGYAAMHCTGAALPPSTTSSTSQPVTNAPSAVENFKHGIKQDPALFMAFKDGKQFDS